VVDVHLSALPNVPIDVHDPHLLAQFATAVNSHELPLGLHPTAVSAQHDTLLVAGRADALNMGQQ
jgi:hypothetical protein